MKRNYSQPGRLRKRPERQEPLTLWVTLLSDTSRILRPLPISALLRWHVEISLLRAIARTPQPLRVLPDIITDQIGAPHCEA